MILLLFQSEHSEESPDSQEAYYTSQSAGSGKKNSAIIDKESSNLKAETEKW